MSERKTNALQVKKMVEEIGKEGLPNNGQQLLDETETTRNSGLLKEMDFNQVSQDYVSQVAFKRSNIPRKSLNYQTPIECFMKNVD